MMADEQDLYDSELARALNLHACCESRSVKVLKRMEDLKRRVHLSFSRRLINFKAEMIELAQQIASAGRKINALIFLPSDMILDSEGKVSENINTLNFTPILIRPSLDFAPPSEAVNMVAVNMVVDDSVKKNREALVIKAQLEKQLKWFQKYGQDDALLSSKTSNSDKPKRHLSIVTEQTSQAA